MIGPGSIYTRIGKCLHYNYVSGLNRASREEASPAHPSDTNLTNVIKTGFNEFGNFDPKLLHDSGRAQAEMCGAVSLLIQVRGMK